MRIDSSDLRLLRETIGLCFVSPNVMDSNGEAANVVDALSGIEASIYGHGEAVEDVARALNRIADALHNRNDAGG